MRRRPRIHQATPPRRRDRIDRQALAVSHLTRPLTLTTHTHPRRRRQRSTSSSSGTLQPLANLQRKRRVEHHRGRVGRDRPRGVVLRVAQVDVRAALLLLLLLEQRLRDGAPYAQRTVVAPCREHEGRRDGVVPGEAGEVVVDVLCLEGVQ